MSRHLLDRDFQDQLRSTSYDSVHIPPDFDSPLPLKRWVIYDFNVTSEMSKDKLGFLEHKCFMASRQGDEMIFIEKEQWFSKAKHVCQSYVWGGKSEQKIVAEMRVAESQKSACDKHV
ncbi:MAG: hypothetical protein M1817_004022 [Caeruleum heppii]|nr:MAG: hypothetical protein M1817_004022 [Caeruleum heppii]